MGGNLSFPTGYYECPVDLPRSQKAIAKLGQDVVLKVVRRINQIELEDRDRIHGEMLQTRFTREEVENGVADKMNKGLVVKHRLERPYGYDASEVVIDLKALADPASHGKHARYAGRRKWVPDPRKELQIVLTFLEHAEMHTEFAPTPQVVLRKDKIERAAGLCAGFRDLIPTPTKDDQWLTKTIKFDQRRLRGMPLSTARQKQV